MDTTWGCHEEGITGAGLARQFLLFNVRCCPDVPPVLSSTAIWSPIPQPKEIGREEAFYRRTDHRLPANCRGRHASEGAVPAARLQRPPTTCGAASSAA
jgi:hypothetical protein